MIIKVYSQNLQKYFPDFHFQGSLNMLKWASFHQFIQDENVCSGKNKLLFHLSYSQQSYSIVERNVQTFKILLSKFNLQKRQNYDDMTDKKIFMDCLFTYRCNPSSETGKSEISILFSFESISYLSGLEKRVSF